MKKTIIVSLETTRHDNYGVTRITKHEKVNVSLVINYDGIYMDMSGVFTEQRKRMS